MTRLWLAIQQDGSLPQIWLSILLLTRLNIQVLWFACDLWHYTSSSVVSYTAGFWHFLSNALSPCTSIFCCALQKFITTVIHADNSRGSKAFIHVCLSVHSIEPKWLKLQSPNLQQSVKRSNIKVTGSQSAKTYLSWRRSTGRREFALYRVASVQFS